MVVGYVIDAFMQISGFNDIFIYSLSVVAVHRLSYVFSCNYVDLAKPCPHQFVDLAVGLSALGRILGYKSVCAIL